MICVSSCNYEFFFIFLLNEEKFFYSLSPRRERDEVFQEEYQKYLSRSCPSSTYSSNNNDSSLSNNNIIIIISYYLKHSHSSSSHSYNNWQCHKYNKYNNNVASILIIRSRVVPAAHLPRTLTTGSPRGGSSNENPA